MNFKPNAWTFLFALSLGALLFNVYSEAVVPNPLDIGETGEIERICPPNSISPDKAHDMIALYKRYLETHKTIIDELKEGDLGVENPDVRYFKIPRCELQEMVYNLNPEETTDVTAHIGIKIDSSNGKNMLDLFFKEENAKATKRSATGEILASKGDKGETKYWDFTYPCPTLCHE